VPGDGRAGVRGEAFLEAELSLPGVREGEPGTVLAVRLDMPDKLLEAASRFEVPADGAAGPGGLPGARIWAHWPRHRLELCHDLLSKVLVQHPQAEFRAEGAGRWRAGVGDWNHVGTFEDAVASLALHLSERTYRERRQRETGELHHH
jgi:hypothetical protein